MPRSHPMGSRALLLLRGVAPPYSATHHPRILQQFSQLTLSQTFMHKEKKWVNRSFSVKSSLEPPDLTRLAQTARISLTPTEVEEFAPKIQQVVDWFGQLQSVDLESIDPAIRAGTDVGSFRDDLPETFENRDAMIASVPSYDDPYIKVPKVLKEE